MGEEPTEGNSLELDSGSHVRGGEDAEDTQYTAAEGASGSGWVNTEVAAAALGVSPRTVRDYIRGGNLEAKSQGEGVTKTWLVSIDSVQKLRDSRRTSADSLRSRRERYAAARETLSAAEDTRETLRELIARLEARTAEAAELRTRLELTERAESTLQAERDRLLEDLARERERADRYETAQEEANKLRAELVAERSKGFWRRLFGG